MHRKGFALPSIMIASIVMLMLLMTAVSSVASTRAALDEQYRNTLMREAAESGIRLAEACMRQNDMNVTWSNAKPLRPNTNCAGDVISGQEEYVLSGDKIRTTFTVEIDHEENGVYTMDAAGTLEQIRTSTNTVWRTSQQALKAEISGIPLFTESVSSGLYQVCAVLSEETWCNGANQSGQMGNGLVEGPLPPAPPAPIPEGSALYLKPERVLRLEGGLLGKKDKIVSSGTERACTITTDNHIYCWGRNDYGALGHGTSLPSPTWYTVPTEVNQPIGMSGKTITALAQGFHSMCALAEGDVWCWGRNTYGELGTGQGASAHRSEPVQVAVIGTSRGLEVTNIASHPYSASFCAVAGGNAYCWGDNTYGQLGNGTTTLQRVPTPVHRTTGSLAGKNVKKIVTSTATRIRDATISGPDGCTPDSRDCYVQAYACALTTDGQVSCWGANRFGQMGQGTPQDTNQLVPIRVRGALEGKTVRDIAASYMTPCALTDDDASVDDRFFCWGSNRYGAGGFGTADQCTNTVALRKYCSPLPVLMQAPGLKGKVIDEINAGANRVCAIASGVSYCSGYNIFGQIGDGTRENRFVPTEASVFRQYRPSLIY